MKTCSKILNVFLFLAVFGLQPLTAHEGPHEGHHGAPADGEGEFQDFPSMCMNERGEVFVVYVDRPDNAGPQLIVASRKHDGELAVIETVRGDGVSAFDRPSLAPLGEGLLLAFSAEIKGSWKVAYMTIKSGKPAGNPVYLDPGGTVNIRPAVAVSGETACIVWESNAGKKRRIYGSLISRGMAGPAVPLSPAGIAAGNPAVTAAGGDGDFFAAWEAFQDENADIYGRLYSGGSLHEVERISDDPRMDRNVSLAAAPDGTLWLAWESSASSHTRINNYDEQKIVVAERSEEGLRMPENLFSENGPQAGESLCKRPVILIDSAGRIHLSVRKTAFTHEGEKVLVGPFWDAEIWTCAGDAWYGPLSHDLDWGWWRPVSMGMKGTNTLYAAIQEGIGMTYLLAKESGSKTQVETFKITAPARRAETVPLEMPESDFDLNAYIEKYSLRLPRQSLDHGEQKLSLYWGDLHEHTAMSQCARQFNPPARDLFLNQRDIDGLDFTALTDHGYNHCSRTWAYTREQVRTHFDPHSFIPLLGVEWTSENYGHHNLVFQETSVSEVYHRSFQGKSPVELYEYISQNELCDFISLPHGLSDCSKHYRQIDWSQVHEEHQPLAEIFQARQSFEHAGCPRESPTAKARPELAKGFYLQDAWENEIIIGTSASPDHGGTSGRTGVWAADLSPEKLFEAFHKRHTFGTSGAKIALYFASGDALMGDKLERKPSRKSLDFTIKVVTESPLDKVVIFRNNQVVHEMPASGSTMEINWTDPSPLKEDRLWYYVRVERADGELAWSSPIWFLSAEEMQNPPTHTLARPKKEIIEEREKQADIN
ncbi:MAG: DUF3604 domain-containing protein [Bacteroidetes bacterium]|nr:DUF3604 domain-containing protein [Bacteroidota bacterium]